MMRAIWTAMLLTIGSACWIAAIAIVCWTSWVFIDEELTQGAMLKRFWFEMLLEVALMCVGWFALAGGGAGDINLPQNPRGPGQRTKN